MPKKSFRYHYRDQYGYERLEYPLFENLNINNFKHIVLRSGYDDLILVSSGTLLRDPLSSEFWRFTGNLVSASKFAHLFLNDQYWGIYNIRESVDEDFIEDHLGTNNFDMIRYQKTGPELKYGDWSEWNRLDSFVLNTNFSNDNAYYQLTKIVDINNFLNLLAFVHCSQYRS